MEKVFIPLSGADKRLLHSIGSTTEEVEKYETERKAKFAGPVPSQTPQGKTPDIDPAADKKNADTIVKPGEPVKGKEDAQKVKESDVKKETTHQEKIKAMEDAEKTLKSEIKILKSATDEEAEKVLEFKEQQLAKLEAEKTGQINYAKETEALNRAMSRLNKAEAEKLDPIIAELINSDAYDALAKLSSTDRALELIKKAREINGLNPDNEAKKVEKSKTNLAKAVEIDEDVARTNIETTMVNKEELFSNDPRVSKRALRASLEAEGIGGKPLDEVIGIMRRDI